MNTACTGRASLWFVVLAAVSCAASAGSQAVFASPDEAATALLAALESEDYSLFLSVAGQQMAGFWDSGDPERGALDRGRFVDAVRRQGIPVKPQFRDDAGNQDRRMLYAGHIQQPFPAPLVKTDSGWRFDDGAGLKELAARHIRRNEIAAIELCQRFHEAEYAYFGMAQGGVQSFAHKIRSTPGQHDGLFWSGGGEEDESPLGPPFAAAAFPERQPAEGARPLFGYYLKILIAQGPDAAGGALDYRTNGRLRKGFAMIAWPAEYGIDGTHSFLINHFGDIYWKDLGSDTGGIAASMNEFNPDRSWTKFNGQD